MIAGFRLWMSVTLMCVGSAMLSWFQTLYLREHFQPDLPPSFDGNAPVENQGRWKPQSKQAKDRDATPIRGKAEKQPTDEKPQKLLNEDVNRKAKNKELADFIEPKDGTITSISLLGERNSGTRWIYG